MNIEELIQKLTSHWDTDGFLDTVRRGNFDADASLSLLDLLRGITIGEDELISKRLLSLLWYLPSFLEWQKQRVAEISPAQTSAYERFVTEVHNTLEDVLGVP